MNLDARSRDLLVRTVLGEAASEGDDGQAAVAAVIMNRLNSGKFGKSVPEVILARNQFEPWNTPQGRSRMYGYASDSEPYQRASAAVDHALAGNDPTRGATHFFAPVAQAQLGRSEPKWAQGQEPTVIGRHNFYGGGKMAAEVTDPQILERFRLSQAAPVEVNDPDVLARFQASQAPAQSSTDPQSVGTVPPAQSQKSNVEKALSPLTGYPETYHGMRREAEGQISRGVDQIKAGVNFATTPTPEGQSQGAGVSDLIKGVGNVAMGGVGYVASPLNAALRSFVGKPVQDATGIPAEYTDFAASLAIPGIGLTRVTSTPVQTQRTLTAGEKVAAAGQNLDNIGTTGPVEVSKAVTTDSTTAQRAASTVRNIPVAGDPLVNAADRTLTQLGQKSQDISKAYGSGSAITAGDTASDAIKGWITGESAKTSSKFYDRVDSLINPAVTTELLNTKGVAQSILNRRANAAISEPSQAVRRIEEAITRPGGLNYEGLKDLRTYIGELKDKPHLLPADISGKELGNIYGAISKDLGVAVQNAGGAQASAAFNRANTHYRLVSERREALAKLVGADGAAPAEKVFDNLAALASTGSRADIGRLAQARKVMQPDEWNEVASAVIARMGRAEDVGGSIMSAGNIAFSPQKFLTAYQDKLSKPGRDLLFRSAGKESIAPYLDDIAMISTRFKELQKFSNPSGTGQIGAGVGMGAGFMADPITTVTAVVGARIMASALAAPSTVAPITQWSKRYEVAMRSPSPANIAMLTVASRNLANTLNAKLGLSVTPDDFLRAIQGGAPGRTDDANPEPERVIDR